MPTPSHFLDAPPHLRREVQHAEVLPIPDVRALAIEASERRDASFVVRGAHHPMRILISGLSRFHQPMGICRHVVNLANCLVQDDRVGSVMLALGEWQNDYFRDCFSVAPQVEKIVVRGCNNAYWRNAWYALGLPHLARRRNADIVHLPFPAPVLRKHGAAVVVSLHDLYPYDFAGNDRCFVRASKRVILRQCLSRVDGIAAVSNSTIESLFRHFPYLRDRRVRWVPNYAALPNAATAPAFAREIESFLLCVAQHQPNKQLDLALRTFAFLRGRGKIRRKTELLIVGSIGRDTQFLRNLADRLGIASRVRWVPPLHDRELRWAYENCDLLLSTSAIEGFCLPVAEALKVGTRVACTDISAHREVAGNLPEYFLPIAKPAEVARAVIRALGRSRTHVGPQKFSALKTASAAIQLYAEALHVSIGDDPCDQPVFETVAAERNEPASERFR